MTALRARWMVPVGCASIALLLAIAPVAYSQARSPVIDLLLSGRDVRTRVQAASTLARLRPAGAREALESALSDPSAAVRASAAQALGVLGDSRAVLMLTAHVNDSDPGVRSGVSQAIRDLQSRPGAGGGMASASAGSSFTTHGNDIGRARFVVRLGTLANHVQARAATVDVLRTAIVQEVGRNEDMACAVGPLPADVERRVRGGGVRVYALEGGISVLRRWSVATQLSVRAEVSLVLMSEPGHAIVGSLSGAATAADQRPFDNIEAFTQRLEERAIGGAVRGALNNLRTSLVATR